MIQKEVLVKIITAGGHAPSGDNCQPWSVRLYDDGFALYNLPDRDNSLYSFGQRASMVALGAFIENCLIKAADLGYKTDIKYFPDGEDSDLVAYLNFEINNESYGNDLARFIEQRITNRKMYLGQLVEPLKVDKLLQTSDSLKLVSEKSMINQLGQIASINERILFENQQMHSFFYNHINWTEEEDINKKIGFYLPTLEIPKNKQSGFKLFKHWLVCKTLNVLLGFSKILAKENSKVYGSASAMGIITIKDYSKLGYIKAGQEFQRVWLQATELGLSFQPLTGVPFLKLRIDNNKAGELSLTHQKLVNDAYLSIQKIFETNDRVAMMFRLGYADSPSAHSRRFNVLDIIQS